MGLSKASKKKIIAGLVIVVVVATVFFTLRGPYISNLLKKVILSELSAATDRQVIAQRIYVNLLPLFLEARGIKAFDKDGNRVFAADKAKVYIGLSGIFKRHVDIKRIVLKTPQLWTDRAQTSEILENIKKYRTGKKKIVNVRVKAITVADGELSYYDEKYNSIITAREINAEVIVRKQPEVSFSVAELALAIKDLPVIRSSLKGDAIVSKDAVEFRSLDLKSEGSSVQASGLYSKRGKGDFHVDLTLLVSSLKKMFSLKKEGEGTVHAKGTVKFENIRDPFLDIEVSGEFYLQTLMELVKAKTKNPLEGWISFNGRLKGNVSALKGSADARLKNGNLFRIKVDELVCEVIYEDGIMSFKNGKGKLYGGSATLEASIKVPKAKPYTLSVSFSDIDSPEALKLIKIKKVKIPYGKVRGELFASGMKFNPEGWVVYKALKGFNNPLGRIKQIKGDFRAENKIVYISNGEIKTNASRSVFNGYVDIPSKTIDFHGSLVTDDVRDLMSPYFRKLTGSGRFEGSVTGKINNPLIEGAVKVSRASLKDYLIGDVEGEISYRKNLLRIKNLKAETEHTRHKAEGIIKFPHAVRIFNLKKPVYNLTVSLEKADVRGLLNVFGIKFPVEGRLDSQVDITGNGLHPVYSGSASAVDIEIYGIPVSSTSFMFSYDYKNFVVKDAVLKNRNSSLYFEGSASRKGDFYFKASSEQLFLKDIIPANIPINYMMALEAEGKGTFKTPDIKASATLSKGEFNGSYIGDGTLNISIKGRDVLFKAGLLNGKTTLEGKAHLTGDIPWSAKLSLGHGRYDFLISSLLEEVPEDMMLSMEGIALLSGNKSHLEASATIDRVNMTLYGQGFSNDSDIEISLDDKKLFFSRFKMRSGSAYFSLSGDLEFNTLYNIVVEGNTSLSPLKGFSKRIDVLRGDANFVFSIQGEWSKPVINGGFSISNASFGLKNIPQRFTSINGYIYVDEDKAVIERISARLGGGDIEITGVAYLKGLGVERFYLDTLISDVTTSVSRGFVVNFGGNILVKGSPESQAITGEVKINRAKYRERLEWKTWLLKAKKAKRKERIKRKKDWADKVSLNVKIYGTENIIIDNNIARAPLIIDLTLRGTIGTPELFGRIESKEGKVYFRNNEFRILNAIADYTGMPGRPVLEILAETSVKGYHILLKLEGRMEQFDLTLTSDPPLDEVEILGLLTVGEFGESLRGLEGGIGAAEATSFLTGKFQDIVEERLKDITGLSRVQIGPYVSKSTGTVTPRINVSKVLMGEKLFVTYSTAVGTTEEQEIRLEYLLGRNISLLGVRDERGSIGGDIKFRFQFK
jgi:translocation and assembly module TamB